MRQSTRCTRRSWPPNFSLLEGRVGLGNGEYLVGVGKSSEVDDPGNSTWDIYFCFKNNPQSSTCVTPTQGRLAVSNWKICNLLHNRCYSHLYSFSRFKSIVSPFLGTPSFPFYILGSIIHKFDFFIIAYMRVFLEWWPGVFSYGAVFFLYSDYLCDCYKNYYSNSE